MVMPSVFSTYVSPQFLEVLAVLEGAVGYHEFQVAVGVLRAAVGLPELDVFHMLVSGNGVPVKGDGLVVVVGAWVVVDAHGAILAVDAIIVNPYDRGVIDIAVVLRFEERGGAEVLIHGVPGSEACHHVGLAGIVVFHTIVVLCRHVAVPAVFHAIDGEVGGGGLVDDEEIQVLLPDE